MPPAYDQLVVKVDWDHESKTAIFQAELSSLLNLEPEVFILKSIEEGCILVTWVVPQSIYYLHCNGDNEASGTACHVECSY